MAEGKKYRINYFKQMEYFYNLREMGELELSSASADMYLYLLKRNNKTGWSEWFSFRFQHAVMTGLGSINTVKKAIGDLQSKNLILVQMGKTQKQAMEIHILELSKSSSNLDEMLRRKLPVSSNFDRIFDSKLDEMRSEFDEMSDRKFDKIHAMLYRNVCDNLTNYLTRVTNNHLTELERLDFSFLKELNIEKRQPNEAFLFVASFIIFTRIENSYIFLKSLKQPKQKILMNPNFTIETLWKETNFTPNEAQKKAILHIEKPLYLTAGPGSGKTRVLLWRTLNLIVFHKVEPDEILLTTFTEKAAHQLKEGLQALLGYASNYTGKQYDVARMFIGTVHSICNRLIADRRFYENRGRNNPIKLIDQLEQYFFLKRNSVWTRLIEAGEIETIEVNAFFQTKTPEYPNKHKAVTECMGLFNRFSEERLNVEEALQQVEEEETLFALLKMYQAYRTCLKDFSDVERCDFALIQEKALEVIEAYEGSSTIFKHVIVDEYQDTNFIQEQLYFKLAGNQNICVVGDDDQALYRFRGSTVENFVEFPVRVKQYLNVETTTIPLSINYRSKKKIVDYYTRFIEKEDWSKDGEEHNQYRVHNKGIIANSKDELASVVYVTEEQWIDRTVAFCKELIDNKIVKDPNQIAFLFPSLGNKAAQTMIASLRETGLNVYAPRAGRFLEGNEATELFGIYAQIFGLPDSSNFNGREFNAYKTWIGGAETRAAEIIKKDTDLKKYVEDRRLEIEIAIKDFKALQKVAEKEKWILEEEFDIDKMRRKLSNAHSLSDKARKALLSPYLARVINERKSKDTPEKPFSLYQIISRATSLDWGLLDLFYQITGFGHFKQYFDMAQNEGNEGSICNLSKLSEFLTKFMELYSPILSAQFLTEEGFSRLFFSSYLYTIFRLGESEYENQENPFPKGNIQFLTIHQSKGLEFPVVFVYPKRRELKNADRKEVIIRRLKKVQGEPLDRINRFDIMRILYVALSRAEKLLILPMLNPPKTNRERSIITYVNRTLGEIQATELATYDSKELNVNEAKEAVLSKPYSYTGDYLAYERCPRQYMIFRKYDFAPSRSETMFFGSLVHHTIEDLHEKLISIREKSSTT